MNLKKTGNEGTRQQGNEKAGAAGRLRQESRFRQYHFSEAQIPLTFRYLRQRTERVPGHVQSQTLATGSQRFLPPFAAGFFAAGLADFLATALTGLDFSPDLAGFFAKAFAGAFALAGTAFGAVGLAGFTTLAGAGFAFAASAGGAVAGATLAGTGTALCS